MKYLIFIWFLMMSGFAFAQTDSLLKSKEVKEAPEDLKRLIKELTAQKAKKVSKDATLEIDGLLVDETKTKSGRDFYDYFFRDWVAPKGAKDFTIFIKEKPYRLTTTKIEIRLNETLVFQSFLQPRGDIVELMAKQAVARTQLYLHNYKAILKQLEGADQSGSGIF